MRHLLAAREATQARLGDDLVHDGVERVRAQEVRLVELEDLPDVRRGERELVDDAPAARAREREREVAPVPQARVRALVVEVRHPPVRARGPRGRGQVHEPRGCASAGLVEVEQRGEPVRVLGGRAPDEVLGLRCLVRGSRGGGGDGVEAYHAQDEDVEFGESASAGRT